MRQCTDMKVLLVSASYPTPFTFHDKFLGLGYLHAAAAADPVLAARAEVAHVFHHIRRRAPGEIAEELAAADPDVAGFGCYVWNTPEVLEIARVLKELRPSTRIVLGGPEVEGAPAEILERHPAVEFVSRGDGEENFRELLRALLEDRDPGGIPGLALRRKDGPVLNPPRPAVKALDLYPSPFLAGVLDLDERKQGAYFQTTRGCPFGCTYCDYGRNRALGAFSLERVRAEIAWFADRGARALFCVDATFNLDRKRAVAVLEAMAEAGLEAHLWIEAHPELLDEPFMEALARLPRVFLGLGLQTVNPEAMKNIRRSWDPERTARLLDRLARMGGGGVRPSLELIMGLPGDDLAAYKAGLTWVYRREAANVFAFILEVLPGAPMWKDRERFQIREGGAGSQHQILSNYSFSAEEVQVGKAITDWNRLLQPIFHRLVRATGLAAGDIIEAWAWHAFRNGLHEHLSGLNRHRIEPALIDAAAAVFEGFLREHFARAGGPDPSHPLRELFRYYLHRRAVTDEGALFTDAPEVHTITLDPADHVILPAKTLAGKPPPPDAREAAFDYDMVRLWPLADAGALAALPPSPRRYLFYTGPRGIAQVVERAGKEADPP